MNLYTIFVHVSVTMKFLSRQKPALSNKIDLNDLEDLEDPILYSGSFLSD